MTLLKNIQKLLAELANEHDSASALNAWAQLTDVIDKLERTQSQTALVNWIFKFADSIFEERKKSE